jgi:NADH-quinone oxidoreductase subunit G
VVLPVAAAVEKAGTYVDWEGRPRAFDQVLRGTNAMPDVRVLHVLADAMGVDLGLPDVPAARAEIDELGSWDGDRASFVPVDAGPPAPASLATGRVVLSTWPLLLDSGRLQDGEPHLAGTARPAVARLSRSTADAVGVGDGDAVAVSTDRGEVIAPVQVTDDMSDGVVWLPTNSGGVRVRLGLAGANGSRVRVRAASADVAQGGDR